jgi:hypothetical protein
MLAKTKHLGRNISVLFGAFVLIWASASSIRAEPTAAKAALVSYDWSVKRAHSLASSPPSGEAVQAFVNAAFGIDASRVCEFRFANLRNSGNLSLVVSVDAGGTGGCNRANVFDKTASGFEDYAFNAAFSKHDGVQDINGDGKFQLILWAPISRLGMHKCEAEEPMVFAWTGSSYREVSKEYPRYYERRLKSLNKHIAANASATEKAQSAASQPEPIPIPPLAEFESDSSSVPGGGYGVHAVSGPRPLIPAAVARIPDSDDSCLRVEAAQTEALLGRHSDSTMSYAVKASESNDPYMRQIAAIILSFVRTSEAKSDLNLLATDSDPEVKDTAKAFSGGSDNSYYAQVIMEPVTWPAPIRK